MGTSIQARAKSHVTPSHTQERDRSPAPNAGKASAGETDSLVTRWHCIRTSRTNISVGEEMNFGSHVVGDTELVGFADAMSLIIFLCELSLHVHELPLYLVSSIFVGEIPIQFCFATFPACHSLV